jgi:hypothetical protein
MGGEESFMALRGLSAVLLAASALGQDQGQARGTRKPARRPHATWIERITDPRRLVPLILLGVVVFGLGRRLWQSSRAKKAQARLMEEDVSAEEVEASVEHGRTAMTELFELLGTAKEAPVRDAAGHALAVLWARDELIPEEEKAIIRRGFQVTWRARKRYPRSLRTEIPVVVNFGVPFLREDGNGVSAQNLRWSYRIEGARRVSLESWSVPAPGRGVAEFTLIPTDFAANGPHRLVLQARVETVGLTDGWTLELPHMPFSFEFDPFLKADALLALPDASRADAFASSARLMISDTIEPRFLDLNDRLAIRGIPEIEVTTPLPCDLAHAVEVEFEGVEGRHPSGEILLSGQGQGSPSTPDTRSFPIGPFVPVLPSALLGPGLIRLRARLVPSPERGWADPDVRSIWPGTIEMGWIEVDVIRR